MELKLADLGKSAICISFKFKKIKQSLVINDQNNSLKEYNKKFIVFFIYHVFRKYEVRHDFLTESIQNFVPSHHKLD